MTQRTKRFRSSRRCHYKFHALLMNIHSPPRHPLTSGARNAPKCKGCLGTICKGCHGPEHKRVRKNVKRKSLNEIRVLVAGDLQTFQNGKNTPHPPALFVRVANAGLTGYGTWKRVRRTGSRKVRGLENVRSTAI